ncbi:hypothetical protein Tco_1211568 [Tanacetum coccineum]
MLGENRCKADNTFPRSRVHHFIFTCSRMKWCVVRLCLERRVRTLLQQEHSSFVVRASVDDICRASFASVMTANPIYLQEIEHFPELLLLEILTLRMIAICLALLSPEYLAHHAKRANIRLGLTGVRFCMASILATGANDSQNQASPDDILCN